jgi:hypothetical protein
MTNTELWLVAMISNTGVTSAVFVCAIITFLKRRELGFLLIAVALGLQVFAFIPSFWIIYAVQHGDAYRAGFVSSGVTGFGLLASLVGLIGWIFLAIKGRGANMPPLRTPASVTPPAGTPVAPPTGAVGR